MKKKIHLGQVAVDSGQLMLVDPCYLPDFEHNDPSWDEDATIKYSNEFSYRGCCLKSGSAKKGGNVGGLRAISFESGYGDGIYDVFAEYTEDNRIKKITIELI